MPSDVITRRTALLSAVAALCGSTLACNRRSGSDTVLDFWTWALRPRFDDYVTRLVAAFEEANPGVRVRWTDVAADAMRRKAFAAGAAGTLPDVINFSDQHFAQFAGLDALLPIDDKLPGDPTSQFVAGPLAANRIDGRLVGLPWYLSTTIRVMNAELLAAGGLSPETVGGDWLTLLEQAGPFKEMTGSYLLSLPLGDRSDLPPMMLADGIEIVRPHADGGYHAALTTPEAVDFVTLFVDAFRDGRLPRDTSTGGYEAMVNGMAGETVALINANALHRIRNKSERVYDKLVVAPSIVGKLGVPGVAVTHVAVGRQTKNAELAAKLAWHVTSPEWQTELAIEAGRVPSTIASLSDPAFNRTGDLQEKATSLSVEQLASARSFAAPTATWPDLRRVFDDGMRSILIDNAEVEPTLRDVEVEWDRILRADAAGMPWR
ncbi:MAG: extracellular solute-binding protein [Planctomycetota bacterium]